MIHEGHSPPPALSQRERVFWRPRFPNFKSRETRFALALLAGHVLILPAWADHVPAKPDSPDGPLVALMDNLGNHEHRITTSKPLAQQYFNQGLRLIYGFNHDEAVRAFKAAAKIDPAAAMPHWGIALALGPNYNAPAEKERAKAAFEALLRAQKLSSGASPPEAAYIEALSKRYSESPDADRKALDTAYSDAMRKLAARYPLDEDAAVLFAEALMDLRPWDLWDSDGQPRPGTSEIVSTLEAVLEKNANHPGANHFYIHAVEASPDPLRALPSALRLGGLMPGAGHMVHMPAHIYVRLGRYGDAVDANKRAIDVDRGYIEKYKPEGMYPMMYFPHNIHFLWAALCVEGRGAEAIAAATEVVKNLPDAAVKEMPMLEYFVPTRLYALVRFHQWDEILKEPAPLAEFTYPTGMWHYARGLAHVEKGQRDAALEQQQQLEKILAATPEDKLVGRHSAARLLQIAGNHLGATLASERGEVDSAIGKLQQAVRWQDALQYDEPPPWFLPMRQPLAALFLKSKRPADAEVLYLEDLKRNPENGWSLHGLELALRAQHRLGEAADVHKRFEKVWARSDVEPF